MIIESLDFSGALSETRMHIDRRLRRGRWRFETHSACWHGQNSQEKHVWRYKITSAIQRYSGTDVHSSISGSAANRVARASERWFRYVLSIFAPS